MASINKKKMHIMVHLLRLITLLLATIAHANAIYPLQANITNGPNDIHFKAFSPSYLNFDRYSFRAGLDTGLALLNENQTILPGYKLHIHFMDDQVTKRLFFGFSNPSKSIKSSIFLS